MTLAVLTQLTVSGVGGVEASPTEDANPGDDLQGKMFGYGVLEYDAGPVCVDVFGGLTRWTGHEAKIPANPFNLEAGRVLEINWGVRACLKFGGDDYRIRVGARFARRGVTWITDDRKGWGPEDRLPDDLDGPRLGYAARLTPFVEMEVDRLILRAWGLNIWEQGHTLPMAAGVIEPGFRLDDQITLHARLEFGELQPFARAFGISRWFSDQIYVAVWGGSWAHPGWRGLVEHKLAARVAFAPRSFHIDRDGKPRDRTIGGWHD